VYWAVAENLVSTHGDGGNRNDNKYIDNRPAKWSATIRSAWNSPTISLM
jgi:hypothetical protein